ncbi:MAG: universal stress protein [Clostridia bacterium]|nr:universal stress protein [Clostridia bacterium]NCC75123.1 universal stress protein [Clostridia bacterium]
MYENILVVSEMSANHDLVLQSLGSLKRLGAKTCFLHQYINPMEANETISTFILDTYRASLDRQKQLLTDEGFAVEVIERGGLLRTDELFELAREKSCSLVVTGSPKHTKIGTLLFGGMTSMIMHHATLPLLTIRIPTAPAPDENYLSWDLLTSHVLFPTDFSENARQAFDHVKQLVTAGVGRVTLLHVQDKSKINPHLVEKLEAFNEADQDRLTLLADELKALGKVEVETRLPFGSPTAEILKVIREHEVSLVVMGSQGHGFIEELYLGSVSHNIARLSDASVLLIPIKRD